MARLREAMALFKQAVNTAAKLLWRGVNEYKVREWLKQTMPLADTIVNLAVDYAEWMVKATRRGNSRKKSVPQLHRPLLKAVLYKNNVYPLSSENSRVFVEVKVFKDQRLSYEVLFKPKEFERLSRKTKVIIHEVNGKLLLETYKPIRPKLRGFSNVFIGVDLNANLRYAAIAAVGVYDPEARKLTVTHLYNLANHIKYGVAKIPMLKQRIAKVQRSGGKPGKYYAKITRIKRDFAHKISAKLIKLALQHNARFIVFEDLRSLRAEKSGARALVGGWIRGLIQRYTEYKGFRDGIEAIYVRAAGTSQECPFCRKSLPEHKQEHHCQYTWIRSNHGFAAVNILKRGVAKVYGIRETSIEVTILPRCPRREGISGAQRSEEVYDR